MSFFSTAAFAQDADGDGIVDARDECPGTSGGTSVDAAGCDNFCEASIVGGEIFMRTRLVEVGARAGASFGSRMDAPAGYHTRPDPRNFGQSARSLGWVADPDRTNWATNRFDGDFFVPGQPEETWGLEFGGRRYFNSSNSTSMDQISGGWVSGSAQCLPRSVCGVRGGAQATWRGSVGGLEIEKIYKVLNEGRFIVMEVTLTNRTGADLADVYYLRSVDPDNNVSINGGVFITTNSIVSQPSMMSEDAVVSATQPAAGAATASFVALGSRNADARVSFGGFNVRNARDVFAGTGGLRSSGTRMADEAISLAFRNSLDANASIRFAYVYALDTSDLEQALQCSALDSDGDGILDSGDPDDDNDGILDIVELNGTDASQDSDGDSASDWYDPDTAGFVDANNDGTDDRYDFDGDGVPNHLDLDFDGDGLPDVLEAGRGDVDTNNDGLPDSLVDMDLDGLIDVFDTTPRDASMFATNVNPPDTDGDGLADYRDRDSDGDGLTDTAETERLDVNSDGVVDGAIDRAEDGLDDRGGAPRRDTDRDGIPDHLDLDSDGDGVADSIEAVDVNADGMADVTPRGVDANRNGIDDAFDTTPAVLPDHDADGVIDVRDTDDDGDGLSSIDERALDNGDADGLPNYLDADDDGDGIPTRVECSTGVHATCEDTDTNGTPDYRSLDSDADGFSDMSECATQPCVNTDGDLLPDFRDADDDGDGLLTTQEVTDQMQFGTPDADGIDARLDTDSDGDGVTDATEGRVDIDRDGIPDYLDPNSSPVDTDGDGVPDTIECGGATATCRDTDGDGTPDHLDTDDDGDGVPSRDECTMALECQDTDSDGIPDLRDGDDDGDSVPTADESDSDLDGDGLANFRDADDDGDGIATIIEANDENADGIGDREAAGQDANSNGIDDAFDVACTAVAPCGAISGSLPVPGPDLDRDGYPDYVDVDADGDGIIDSIECGEDQCRRSDADSSPDYLDSDSDADGIMDAVEAHDVDHNGVADRLPSAMDVDGDGLDDAYDAMCSSCVMPGVAAALPDFDEDEAPDYRDADDDGDGIQTVRERADETMFGMPDGDGIPAYLDRDSDGDGATDLVETAELDLDSDGVPDYLDADSVVRDQDADGLADPFECRTLQTPESCPDTDSDGTPDYLDADDDGDMRPTADERPQGNVDTDGDGTFDHLDNDDDGDGALTADELGAGGVALPRDTDMDGIIDALDADDDGDGIPSAMEGRVDTDGDGMADAVDADDDGDGLPTAVERMDAVMHGNDVDQDGRPNWLDTDADGDTRPDMTEGRGDTDADGVPDYLDNDGMVTPVDPGAVPGYSGGAFCSTSSGQGAGWFAFLLVVLVRRRRRR